MSWPYSYSIFYHVTTKHLNGFITETSRKHIVTLLLREMFVHTYGPVPVVLNMAA